ncbi:hypothetical protein, partial [Gelidibacter salicanalis]|uniref:hypothetical protein n=1 Tax=Gelidibacter salicanalis TaxID=291193 RepID=UPI001B875450
NPKTFYQLKQYVKKAVTNYNEKRVHRHLPKMSPNTFQNYWNDLTPDNRPMITIFNNEINN